MPLELGADLGLRLKGGARHRRRRILVLDAVAHRYDQTLSDISGMDTRDLVLAADEWGAQRIPVRLSCISRTMSLRRTMGRPAPPAPSRQGR
jgi:hypothetical protein